MTNANIARLLGYSFGDGNIHRKKYYFIYTNSNTKLMEEVVKIVKEEFPNVVLNNRMSGKGIPQIQFSAMVGRKLVGLGAVNGSKTTQEMKIPKWIKESNEIIKANFLGAIFDDEGYFRDERGKKQIVIKFSKINYLEENLNSFLKEISSLLNDLKIKVSDIKKDQIKNNSKGEIMISKRIWITGKENFLRFKEKILLFHPERIRKLTNICSYSVSVSVNGGGVYLEQV